MQGHPSDRQFEHRPYSHSQRWLVENPSSTITPFHHHRRGRASFTSVHVDIIGRLPEASEPVSFDVSSCSSRYLLQAYWSLRTRLLCVSDQQPSSVAIMNVPLISCSTMTEQDNLRSARQRTLAHVAPYRYFDTVDCLTP